VKAQFEAKKKVAPTSVVATVATTTTNGVAPADHHQHHHQCFKCSKGVQRKDVAVTDQFGHRFCFDCIVTSVSNIDTDNGNAHINLTCDTTTTKTCSACGQDGHCRTKSKKCPIYWQRRK
jgi:hypothetical protein